MEFAYSGYYSGSPEYGSLFQHIFFSELMHRLYTVSHLTNWYGIALNILLTLASCLLSYRVIHSLQPAKNALSIFIILFAYCQFSIRLNFATVAFFCGFSGLACLYSNLKIYSKSGCVACLLVLCSMLIRPDFFMLSFILSMPLLIHASKLNFKTALLKSVVLLSVYFSFNRINHYYYQKDPIWSKSYAQYNSMIYLLDNQAFNLYYVRNILPTIDWTENDYLLFKNFYFEMPGKLELEKINALIQAVPRDAVDAEYFYPTMIKHIPFEIHFAILVTILIGIYHFGFRHFALNVLYLVLLAVALQYLSGNKYVFKDRMLYPIVFSIGFFNLFKCFYPSKATKATRYFNFSLFILLSITLSLQVRNMRHKVTDLARIDSWLSTKYRENCLLDFYCYYPNAGYKNWESSAIQTKSIRFLPMGWILNTPLGKNKLKQLGFNSMNEALLNHRTRHLVPNTYREAYQKMIEEYAKEYNSRSYKITYIDSLRTSRQTWLVGKAEPGD